MTFKVRLSSIRGLGDAPFSELVDRYIQELIAHRDTPLSKDKKASGPSPIAHPLIMAAVRRVPQAANPAKAGPDNFVADYEIIDDTPPPAPPETLEQRKARLIFESRQQETADIESIMPSGKRRLLEMDYAFLSHLPKEEWEPAQQEVADRHQSLMKEIQRVRYEAAKREAEIEDLRE